MKPKDVRMILRMINRTAQAEVQARLATLPPEDERWMMILTILNAKRPKWLNYLYGLGATIFGAAITFIFALL